MDRKSPAVFTAVLVSVFMQVANADSAPTQNVPDGQVFIAPVQAPETPATTVVLKPVEVRNNSTFVVSVFQKGKKETLQHNGILTMDLSNGVITLSTTTKTDAVKFITLSGKTGACQQENCLTLQ
ncbi:hypothetical protein ACWHY4_08640 [Pseudomonas sp. E2-15]